MWISFPAKDWPTILNQAGFLLFHTLFLAQTNSASCFVSCLVIFHHLLI